MAEAHISGKKLTQALREMKEISRMDFVLFSKKGKLLASTCPEPDMKMQEFVTQFGKSMAESQTIQDWIFLKIENTFYWSIKMEVRTLPMSLDGWQPARSEICTCLHKSR